MALSHRAASSLQLGQEPGGLSGLHSARSSYLAVSSSPSTPRSTRMNRQNAAPALHSPRMKVILRSSGRCWEGCKATWTLSCRRCSPWKVALSVSSLRIHAAPPPPSWGPRMLFPPQALGGWNAASSWGHMWGQPATKHVGFHSVREQRVLAESGGTETQFQEVLCLVCVGLTHTPTCSHVCTHIVRISRIRVILPCPTHNSVPVV